MDDLRAATDRLIESALTEVSKAGRDAADVAAQRLLENRRAEIEAAGREASRKTAESLAHGANGAMARIGNGLKDALAAEEASRLEVEIQRKRDEARAKQEQEERRIAAEQVAAEQLAEAKLREQARTRFEIKPGTSIAGGATLGPVYVSSVLECAVACLQVRCEAFAYYNSGSPHMCYRYRGRGVVFFENQYYTAGRLR